MFFFNPLMGRNRSTCPLLNDTKIKMSRQTFLLLFVLLLKYNGTFLSLGRAGNLPQYKKCVYACLLLLSKYFGLCQRCQEKCLWSFMQGDVFESWDQDLLQRLVCQRFARQCNMRHPAFLKQQAGYRNISRRV